MRAISTMDQHSTGRMAICMPRRLEVQARAAWISGPLGSCLESGAELLELRFGS